MVAKNSSQNHFNLCKRFACGNKVYIKESRYNEIKNKFGVPQKGDILLTSVGTLGIPYLVKDEIFYFKDGNITWFYNFKGINNRYLYYWFLSPIAKHYFDIKAIGSTQKALTIETLKKFDIVLPSKSIQQKVADVLKSFDDKIELNNRINANLEEQAQALFRRWFVDFEFPNDEGRPYKSHGGDFVESELGRMPKGWKICKLSELIDIRYGKDHKKLSNGSIPVYGSGGIMRYVSTALYSGESVLIPRKGSLNNIIYVNESFWSVDTMFYSIMKHKYIAKYIFLLLNSKNLASMNTGSAVPSMTTDVLNNLIIKTPQPELLKSFDSIISSYYHQIEKNKSENLYLSSLRDTLLPKLMNNEIQI